MSVELVAVSKTHPVEYIVEAYSCGQRIFGENKVQEMDQKHEALKDSCPDIKWHLIGHLQTNKVKYITSYVDMIHSVDSLKLLQEIDKHAKKDGRVIKCLFEMHIASEETKFGLDRDELVQILESPEFKSLQNVKICGLMGMAYDGIGHVGSIGTYNALDYINKDYGFRLFIASNKASSQSYIESLPTVLLKDLIEEKGDIE